MFDKSFLEDEIRSDFYIPASIKQAWAAELEVLNAIDEVCSKCNINYYAEWGTMLGAIRHGGFVPWDDDLDIAMLRDDYDIFLEKAPSLLPNGYEIRTFRNEEGFREFRATVINASSPNFNKEHFDKFHGFCYLCGIDVYVLDNVLPNYQGEDDRFKNILYLISLADNIYDNNLPFSKIMPNLDHVSEITGVSLHNITNRKELWLTLYELAEKKCSEISKEKGKEISLLIPWGLKKSPRTIQARTEYENPIRLPFEYTDIPVPKNYKNIISKRFSNYEKLVKQGGSHSYPFFQKQIDELYSLMGNAKNEYVFNEISLNKNSQPCEWKSLLSEALTYLDISFKNINTLLNDNALNSKSLNELLDLIANSQETAIEAGNLVEAIKGEDCPSISLITKYCEDLFCLYSFLNSNFDTILNQSNLNSFIKSDNSLFSCKSSFDILSKELDSLLRKKEIVFMPFKSSAWKSFEDIYTKYVDNPNYDVYVVPIPYYFKEYDSTLSDVRYSLNSYPDDLKVLSYEDFSLEYRHPDKIFIQNPYDEYNPVTSIHPDYYSSIIKNFTDCLIYVPWFKSCEIADDDSFTYTNMKHFVTVPGVINSDLTLLCTEQERKMYIKKLNEWSGSLKYQSIWENKVILISDFQLN